MTFELCSAISFRGGLLSDILGAFSKLRNATISFMSVSVHLSARMELGSIEQIFMKFDMSIFRKSVEKIEVSLKPDKITTLHMKTNIHF